MRTRIDLDGRIVRLSNQDKELYPGFTKGQVVDYYVELAPVLLPHLANRPVTLRRWPDGVSGPSFFEKNLSRSAPDWVESVRIATPGSTKDREYADFLLISDAATLAWAANLAALELHIPQWTVGARGARKLPDLLVFDLDPGPGTSIVECCRVAELIGEHLGEHGLTGYPKTSGSKGMQLYVPIRVSTWERPADYAKRLAERLTAEHPRSITATMSRSARDGKVFIDWSQNNGKKTTIAPYSLRGREQPSASTPITWDEVRACAAPEDLVFGPEDVLKRVSADGDLLADLHDHPETLPRSA
ncbi:ATP-dependent DNA ligase [Pseudonocardiaceae bacterium YIM PH 21723]|nr:ATP-dependent DNA ligase [Pseudonocardiaceae bacterium YIM PH 21723]